MRSPAVAKAGPLEIGTILHTTDAGTTWTIRPSGTSRGLWSVSFLDTDNGLIVGDTGGVYTSDGGTSWTERPGPFNLRSVVAVDADHAWAVGIYGYIAAIASGGATWNVQESGTERMLQGVGFADAEHGVVVGEKGTLLSTSDGGTTWTAQPAGVSLNDVACAGPDQWWVVGDEGVILKRD